MNIFRRIGFNLGAFFLGTFLFCMFVLVFFQNNNSTASISDAFVNQTSNTDMNIIYTISGLSVYSNRNFDILDTQSFRINFLYNTDTDTSSRALLSPYPHSLSLQNGEGVIIISLDHKKINANTYLFELLAPIDDTNNKPILESILWHGNDTAIQNLTFHDNAFVHSNKNI